MRDNFVKFKSPQKNIFGISPTKSKFTFASAMFCFIKFEFKFKSFHTKFIFHSFSQTNYILIFSPQNWNHFFGATKKWTFASTKFYFVKVFEYLYVKFCFGKTFPSNLLKYSGNKICLQIQMYKFTNSNIQIQYFYIAVCDFSIKSVERYCKYFVTMIPGLEKKLWSFELVRSLETWRVKCALREALL